MDLIQAILMGIVQGLSEFLPISSSAHLVFTSNIYKIFKGIEIVQSSNQEILLDIMLHLGTLIAVLIFFRKEICEILEALSYGIKTRNFSEEKCKIGLYIIWGTIITCIVAIPLINTANKLVYHPFFVGILLVITGLLLILSEYISKRISNKKVLDWKASVLIGIAQGLAVLPGFSRSGLTISAGLLRGCDRTKSAKYSFLLSMPIILGASMIYPLVNIDLREALTYNWTAIIIGTIVSGVVGYLCIKYFLKFISKFSLNIFGYYCLIAGFSAIIFFMFKG